MMIPEEALEAMDPMAPRVRKMLEAAEANGWEWNAPGFTLVGRLYKPSDPLAKPMFIRWDLHRSPEGKLSWRFAGARASNGQPLNYGDALVYLEDSSVIHPEPPETTQEEQ